MASTTPVNDTPVPAAAPVASPAPVAVKADVAPKADPAPTSAPAKIESKIVEATKSVAASIEKVAQKVVAPIKAVTPAAKPGIPAPKVAAPAKTPVAKKKAVVKAARRTPVKAITKTVKPTIAAAVATAKAIPTKIAAKEETIMETTIKNAADKAKTMMSDANAKSTQAFGEINDFAKGNIEAIVESGKIAAKGVEAMGQDAAEYSRKQFESATAALKTLSTVKSPTDFFKLQGDFMRTSFDSLVAQTSKNTETFLKLAGEVAQPIQNRVSIAAEKIKIAA